MEYFYEFKFYRSVGNFVSCFKGRFKDNEESIYLIRENGEWKIESSYEFKEEFKNSIIKTVNEYFEKKRTEVIHLILQEDFLPLNMQVIREDSGFRTAMYEMIAEGTLRFRNCEGSAVELNEV